MIDGTAGQRDRSAVPFATPPLIEPMTGPLGLVSREAPMMGGRVGIHVQPADARSDTAAEAASRTAAEADAVLRRISAWADRLTRFTTASELSRLNADPRSAVPVGPTLAAVLDWGRYAEGLTGGMVDIGLLDARLAAESGAVRGGLTRDDDPTPAPDRTPRAPQRSGASRASRSWSLDRRARGAVVRRPAGLRFDLDGVGKGWLADRAIVRLAHHASAVVDADGDVAIHLGPDVSWWFGIADPRLDAHDLALLRLTPRGGSGRLDGRFGLATSGTSVHRWDGAGGATHHLIDPRSGRSATTNVVQATVLARTAREAEALAKSIVILGAAAGYDLVDRVGVDGAILLTDQDELLIHPGTLRWLA
jgi:thiamine biosynthesis lipoprotein